MTTAIVTLIIYMQVLGGWGYYCVTTKDTTLVQDVIHLMDNVESKEIDIEGGK